MMLEIQADSRLGIADMHTWAGHMHTHTHTHKRSEWPQPAGGLQSLGVWGKDRWSALAYDAIGQHG